MRLEPIPRQDHALRVSARLITASNILHLAADELEHAVNHEQMENPALEVREMKVCLFCGTQMYGQICGTCRHLPQPMQPTAHSSESFAHAGHAFETQWASQIFYDSDNSGFAEADRDGEYDPLALMSMGKTLAEALLHQLEALTPPADASIAEQLVGNLDERGYLEMSVNEIADHLQVPLERVEYVLHQLQTLEPPGIGARNLRECLLIQLQALSERKEPYPLAYTLIERYLNALGRNQFHEIARELNVPEQEVRAASLYVRTTLHPFPAYIYRDDVYYMHPGSDTTYIRPDVVIRKGDVGFEVELIEEKRYRFSVGTGYPEAAEQQTGKVVSDEVQRYIYSYSERARFFIDCVGRRWRTLKRVMELVVGYQSAFLEKGIRYLRPLTRAEIAARLGLDEGTVSRATANKYALLPNGRLIPIADFFAGSLSVKDIIRELIASEDPKRRLSDEELAQLLTTQGIPIARRTVTKYREEMRIRSSRERG